LNSHSLNRIWVIETVSLKIGYYWKDMGKVEEVLSDLPVINIWLNFNSPNQIWVNGNKPLQIWIDFEILQNYEHVVVSHHSY